VGARRDRQELAPGISGTACTPAPAIGTVITSMA
jgi:hypothetical protein